MDEFAADLRELDETQERVEAVSDGMLRALKAGDEPLVRAMVARWIQALRASDFQAERVAFLFVANHVLHKADGELFRELFGEHMAEAVALVCNSPMDRHNVTKLLELWHEKAIFSDAQILELWKGTGEELPPFLQAVDTAGADVTDGPTPDALVDEGSEEHDVHLPHALPMKLNARSANPALDVLKKIDHLRAAVQFLEQQIRERHQHTLMEAQTMYMTAEDLLDDRTTSPQHMRQRVEECLRLVKVRNKFVRDTAQLKEELVAALAKLMEDEESAGGKIEQQLEQCDLIDIGLADLAEHRDRFPEEWSKAAYVCMERRKQREEEQRLREEEMARLHQEALAESAAHAMNLEADINAASASELQSLSKELDGRTEEQEAKPDETNEMVWHPVLRELVPLQSLNVEWESWRDH